MTNSTRRLSEVARHVCCLRHILHRLAQSQGAGAFVRHRV